MHEHAEYTSLQRPKNKTRNDTRWSLTRTNVRELPVIEVIATKSRIGKEQEIGAVIRYRFKLAM